MQINWKEIFSFFIILLLYIVTFYLIDPIYSLIVYMGQNLFILIKYIVIYLILWSLLIILYKRFNKKFIGFILAIFSVPLLLLQVLFAAIYPLLSSLSYLILYLVISFIIPLSVYRLSEYFNLLELKLETWIYLIVTSGVIISTLFHTQIRDLTFKVIPGFVLKEDKKKNKKIVDICNYIVSPGNIKLVIYVLFFIALLFFNFQNFQEVSFFKIQNIDAAILQSFLTFIAFERILMNIKLTKFRPSELLILLKESVLVPLKRYIN